jgi:predicted SnoaL-like aldol condensation-catalyzing enzyme
MNVANETTNKALVLVALDTLFNKRDYWAAEQYWWSGLTLHCAHSGPGRHGLFDFVKAAPTTLRYEPGLIVANEDYVIVLGRMTGNSRPTNRIVATILRIEGACVAEQWELLQEEALQVESPQVESKSERPILCSLLMESHVAATSPEQNKALVLQALDVLFNKRDYVAAARFWSQTYIQHSAHIPPGRDGLFNLVHGLPDTLRYENHVILAEGDYVVAHGRYSGHGRPASRIAVDVVRVEDGKLAEHWDVIQDEATQAESLSGLPMFGNCFPA